MKARKGHKRILGPCCTVKDKNKRDFESIYIKEKRRGLKGVHYCMV
jgi:hypothetical protein